MTLYDTLWRFMTLYEALWRFLMLYVALWCNLLYHSRLGWVRFFFAQISNYFLIHITVLLRKCFVPAHTGQTPALGTNLNIYGWTNQIAHLSELENLQILLWCCLISRNAYVVDFRKITKIWWKICTYF